MKCKQPTSPSHTISKGGNKTMYIRHGKKTTSIVTRKSKNKK